MVPEILVAFPHPSRGGSLYRTASERFPPNLASPYRHGGGTGTALGRRRLRVGSAHRSGGRAGGWGGHARKKLGEHVVSAGADARVCVARPRRQLDKHALPAGAAAGVPVPDLLHQPGAGAASGARAWRGPHPHQLQAPLPLRHAPGAVPPHLQDALRGLAGAVTTAPH
eukprot:8119292-Pyramimonas_sp.AAC.1